MKPVTYKKNYTTQLQLCFITFNDKDFWGLDMTRTTQDNRKFPQKKKRQDRTEMRYGIYLFVKWI